MLLASHPSRTRYYPTQFRPEAGKKTRKTALLVMLGLPRLSGLSPNKWRKYLPSKPDSTWQLLRWIRPTVSVRFKNRELSNTMMKQLYRGKAVLKDWSDLDGPDLSDEEGGSSVSEGDSSVSESD